MNWHDFFQHHTRGLQAILALKKLRIRTGKLVVLICIAESLWYRKQPLDLTRPNGWAALGLGLIAAGVFFRFWAFGCLRKKEQLATTGVYSLCRHPLYLGSLLLAYGFCVLLNNPFNLVVVTLYLLAFYPFMIVREEARLTEQYGDAHRAYCRQTPAVIPIGRFRPSEFSWTEGLRRGGGLLVGVVTASLAVLCILVRMAPQQWFRA